MSELSQQLEAYLRLRRSLGHGLAEAARLLPRFVTFLEDGGAEFVTLEAALAWSLEPEAPAGSTVWGKRMTVVRGFARYLSGIDPRTEVPPAGAIPTPRRWRPPFIYSEADIVALMEEARRSIPQPLRAATFETLIGLLAATGLRVGEALRLDRRDVDFGDGVLSVRESKFGKSRQVPLQPSVLRALQSYAARREELCPHPRSESFFVSLRGTRVIYACVRPTFRMLCEGAGVGVGAPHRPRIHDLRHTFAVRALLCWYREGLDVGARLPWLSTYLGHREPRYTYHYLSAAPELLEHAARLLEHDEAVGS
ncbi:MAG TPA: tyrosine-type recombinase/integrase [Solirubrobacterales bacterium]|nr:tyrosine-type recombinase/integrase [Solirubrobacterales bacterium]